MKTAVVMLIIIAVGLLVASSNAQDPLIAQELTQRKPQKENVSVAITTVAVRESVHTRSDALLLWNRNQRSLPIGHAVKACIKTGSGAIFGGGVMSCTLNISLPLGEAVSLRGRAQPRSLHARDHRRHRRVRRSLRALVRPARR